MLHHTRGAPALTAVTVENMSNDVRAGRPRASSHETLAEAACELFLEQGYEATSIADIARRAGVSRSSFFNYFPSKADVIWGGLDARLDQAVSTLDALVDTATPDGVFAALHGIVADFAPDALALALRHRTAMVLDDELERDTGVRHARLAAAIARAAHRAGTPQISADIIGSAVAATLFAALRAWADSGAGRVSLDTLLARGIRTVSALEWT